MSQIIPFHYENEPVRFNSSGWINATDAAKRFGKRVDHWLANSETQQYLAALAEALNTRNSGDLIYAQRGRNGGTWLHPKLAVGFARWLDVKFAVWCDMHIDALLRGEPDVVGQYSKACKALSEGIKAASSSAESLARWRWSKEAKRRDVERLAQQLQLILEPYPQ
ncbi:hypothetical protein FX985_00642 [Pseudomonas extremaustralis]|uniref:KilA-N domain-containing protein n=1 Tax=Pseudomonas extremaustralis TaxID=359110 RepID=A0A5M9IX32_9PSED|nr:KilA-N domain-containing protein [Pseudomonas extremaustralis]KAA8560592.1 hypothetical protein FX985_00642 [Pseudomonas extremaustralis]